MSIQCFMLPKHWNTKKRRTFNSFAEVLICQYVSRIRLLKESPNITEIRCTQSCLAVPMKNRVTFLLVRHFCYIKISFDFFLLTFLFIAVSNCVKLVLGHLRRPPRATPSSTVLCRAQRGQLPEAAQPVESLNFHFWITEFIIHIVVLHIFYIFLDF